MLNSGLVPQWLASLLVEKFFNTCTLHQEARKNEKNIFCLDCCHSICPHCVTPHASHRLLQIRRYVYNDVIRLADAGKLMNCASVQSYITNSAKVVFINQRPQPRPCKGSTNACCICDRALQDSYLYCSLYCKIQHLLTTDQAGVSKILYNCEQPSLPEPGSDYGFMTPDSVLEPAGSIRTDSGSSGSGCVAAIMGCQKALSCTATTEVVRRKRSGFGLACRAMMNRPVCKVAVEVLNRPVSDMNRRKGNRPQRAPLY